MYRVLVTIVHCMAPVLPFYCEHLYQRLIVDTGLAIGPDGDSVHLQSFPSVDESLIDLELERQVERVREVVGLAMALRERERIGVRRPLPSLTVASRDAQVRDAVLRFAAEIEGELNVKSVLVVEDDGELVSLSAKANFKVLGRRLGKSMKVVAQAVEGLDVATLRRVLDGGTVVVESETLGADDLVFRREPLPGRVADSNAGITVVLDTNVDAALEQEGLARELINRVQNLRKTADLDVSDRIELAVACAPAGKLAGALAREDLQRLIEGETLAKQLLVNPGDGVSHDHRGEDEIDGESLELRLRRC